MWGGGMDDVGGGEGGDLLSGGTCVGGRVWDCI